MTAQEIQRAIMRERYRASFILPNYTPLGWFEMDVMEITKSNYLREYEIKISRSDFRADASKTKRIWNWNADAGRGNPTENRKHDALNQAHEHGPRQFWYVTPKDLVTVDEVPNWAGLIYMVRPEGYNKLCEQQIKKAPNLHSHKIRTGIQEHAQGVCYWRLHSQFAKHYFADNQTTKV